MLACALGSRSSPTVFYQFFPFVAITRFCGVFFRSQRLRLARLMGEFSDGFLSMIVALPCSIGYATCFRVRSSRFERGLNHIRQIKQQQFGPERDYGPGRWFSLKDV